MSELTVYTSASDGYLKSWATTFQDAHDATTGGGSDTGDIAEIGIQSYYITGPGEGFNVFRSFLFFDTSSLPDNAVITEAILSIYVSAKYVTSGEDFNVVIQNGQPTYPHDPLEVGDYLYSHYSGDGGSKNTANITQAQYNNIILNSTGKGWISLTGATKLCLRSNADINQTGIEYPKTAHTDIYTYDYGVDYRAKLTITYALLSTVTIQAVTAIGETTATGNGNITDLGGENCTKRGICWNTTGSPTIADSKSEETGSFGTGAFTRPMTGLIRGDRYYVKAYAYNSAGYAYSAEVNFYTYPSVTTYAPTNIIRADPTVVTANGLIDLDVAEDITTRGFKYGLTEEDTWDESETGTYSEGTFSLQLTGLTVNTTYYIRAYAVGAWGTKYSSYLEFITAIPYGSFEIEITAEATASDTDIALVGGKRSLAIDNHLIQTQTIADLVAAGYLADYKDQKTKLRITKPTPPPYSIGDTVERISAKLPYAPAVSAVIAYAPATDGLYYYNLAGRDMLIRKLNVSFSAGDYVSVIELEN